MLSAGRQGFTVEPWSYLNSRPASGYSKCPSAGIALGTDLVPGSFPEVWIDRQLAEKKAEVEKKAKLHQQKRDHVKNMGFFVRPADLFL